MRELENQMRELEVFDFKHDLSGLSDHQVDAPDGTAELMGQSWISCNILIWVLVLVVKHMSGSVSQPT